MNKIHNINFYRLFQWIMFVPLTLPLAIFIGIIEGVKKVYLQAKEDILQKEETFFQ